MAARQGREHHGRLQAFQIRGANHEGREDLRNKGAEQNVRNHATMWAQLGGACAARLMRAYLIVWP
eukprot:scaffold234184_cov37-Tisochrysis_lutea.AAC.7